MEKRITPLLLIFALLFSSCDLLGIKYETPGSQNDVSESQENNRDESGEPEKPIQDQQETEDDEAGQNEDGREPVGQASDASKNDAPSVINPLTGLPASDPDNLKLPPALVSVTNFPPTARPQAGLSFSPIVFELYIGDGMTRYLALFYGDYPHSTKTPSSDDLEGELNAGIKRPEIGPIRSGRIPYEHIRKLFNGFIVMASAYSRVAEQLSDYVNVFGDDQSDSNSAMVAVDDIETIAKNNEKELGEAGLDGMVFDDQPPQGGADAQSIWLYYAYKNQVFWRYDETDGTYHRWQDNADGETFIEQTDRLNDEPLAYENVVVLLVDHDVEQQYFIDLDLLYVEKDKALIFRDGKVHHAYWTTKSEEYEQTTGKLRPIRFIDTEGNPFPLKPGQTWVELIPTHSPIWETVESDKYHVRLNGRSKGSGHWAVWFEIDY